MDCPSIKHGRVRRLDRRFYPDAVNFGVFARDATALELLCLSEGSEGSEVLISEPEP
jgi:hypothetical protein